MRIARTDSFLTLTTGWPLRKQRGNERITWTISLALYAAEAAAFVSLVALYRAATKADIWSFINSTPGELFVCMVMITVVSIGFIIRSLMQSATILKKPAVMAIGMNLIMFTLLVGSIEILAGLFSKETAVGETLLGVRLYPKDWAQFSAYYRNVIDEMNHKGSFEIYDPTLGWVIGPSRTDKTGLYSSSAEGLRSPRAGMVFADLTMRHSGAVEMPASVRIALIGDSMTYGYEVRCEESWGHALEGLLQPHAQILNFALGGQGLNQTLLRYEKDVRSWKPQIVIIGITSSMITRNNNIYPFLKDPEWADPLSRPRFLVKAEGVAPVSDRIPDAMSVFSKTSIAEVPNIQLDDYYRPYQWKRGGIWRVLEGSYLFRLAYSIRAPSDDRETERNQSAMQIGQMVVRRLVHEVTQDGAVPLVVYLPYKDEVVVSAAPERQEPALSERLLKDIGIEYFDPTACLRSGEISDAYMEGSHYSPQGSIHIARCLEPVIRKIFNDKPSLNLSGQSISL